MTISELLMDFVFWVMIPLGIITFILISIIVYVAFHPSCWGKFFGEEDLPPSQLEVEGGRTEYCNCKGDGWFDFDGICINCGRKRPAP
jgi:hypothetical protein